MSHPTDACEATRTKADTDPGSTSGSSHKTPEPVTLVLFSGDFDRAMAAFTLALSAAASGSRVSVFFTFWGLSVLRKGRSLRKKSFLEKALALMLPSGPHRLGTSKMNMGGIGPAFFKTLMKRRNVQGLPELIELCQQMGVRFVACQTSMELMGIAADELRGGVEFGGATACLADAQQSGVSLFI